SACQSLINLANERGGEDNITVVIAQFSGAGLSLPESASLEPQSLARSPDTPTEIDWGGDLLSAPTAPVVDPSSAAEAVSTEPLPPPPEQPAPHTSKLVLATTELPRATDRLDSREPITAVYAPEDLNDDPNSSPLPPAKTESFESHDSRPI